MFWMQQVMRCRGTVLVAANRAIIAGKGICLLAFLSSMMVAGRSVQADFTFGAPVNLGPAVNSSAGEGAPSISADGLSLYFASLRPGGYGSSDIWATTRTTVSDPWREPVNLGPAVNSSAWDGELSISSDGLSLYFGSQRSGGQGMTDIWAATRASASDPWEEAVNLGPMVNSTRDDVDTTISADGLSLYIESNRAGAHGGTDLWVARRTTDSDAWGTPMNLGPTVNTGASDGAPSLSADGRMLFFSDHPSPRSGGYGGTDLWLAMRVTVSDPWGEPMNLGSVVNSSAKDQGPSISADGSTLYFFSTRPGGLGDFDLWQTSIIPIVDFNGDGKADGKDVVILTEHWGQSDSVCDIGPYAWGDGIVNEEDLFVLAEYLDAEEPFVDPTLIAHWALDETEGMAAADDVGGSDAMVMGNAAWQPEGGKIGGALAFDGVDDFVLADFPVGLGDEPFSVCAWIMDGAPGRDIVSAQGDARWLYTNAIDGSLMTDLGTSAWAGTPLFSDAVVTDGQWHRVMLVWDGTSRILCVDEQQAATEPLSEVSAPAGKLIIGGSGSLEPESLWSGLIDDVRIYNRAVRP